MKLTTVGPLLAALAPMASAGLLWNRAVPTPSCKGNYATTISVTKPTASTKTVTATVKPTLTSILTTTTVLTQGKIIFKGGTVTKTTTSVFTKTTPLTTTITTTSTNTDDAVTITPDPTTSTISTAANFIPAASALVTGPQKRAAIKLKGQYCSVNVFKASRTVTSTITTIKGDPYTSTITTSAKSTTVKTTYLGGTTTITVGVTSIIVATSTITATSTVVEIPTSTADPQVDYFYEACQAANLLNYTISNNTPTLRRRGLFRRDNTNVGINTVLGDESVVTVAMDADDATSCCEACQQNLFCSGSYYDNLYGTCNMLVGTICPNQRGQAGSFFYDNNMLLDVGSSIVVSNGLCGTWSNGGDLTGVNLFKTKGINI